MRMIRVHYCMTGDIEDWDMVLLYLLWPLLFSAFFYHRIIGSSKTALLNFFCDIFKMSTSSSPKLSALILSSILSTDNLHWRQRVLLLAHGSRALYSLLLWLLHSLFLPQPHNPYALLLTWFPQAQSLIAIHLFLLLLLAQLAFAQIVRKKTFQIFSILFRYPLFDGSLYRNISWRFYSFLLSNWSFQYCYYFLRDEGFAWWRPEKPRSFPCRIWGLNIKFRPLCRYCRTHTIKYGLVG